ncbi:MAG: glycosyltransferase family 2 protein [Nanoarchaeota archaeon]
METWIVVPAFNEENKIKGVVSELNRNGYTKIVIVDDCSRDNTSSVSSNSGATVLRHIINRGQGAALQTGIDYALEQGAEAIVTFDADGQHHPEDIIKLLQPIEKGIADVALGSRFLGTSSNTPLVRKVFLKGGAAIFRLMYGLKLTDSHNGLRALSRKAAKKIKITQDRMEHASEIVEEISKHQLKYVEIPVTITYTDYSTQHGQKTSNAFKILLKMMINKIIK